MGSLDIGIGPICRVYIFGFFCGGPWGDDPRRGSIPGRNKWEITSAHFFVSVSGRLGAKHPSSKSPSPRVQCWGREAPKLRGAPQQTKSSILKSGAGVDKHMFVETLCSSTTSPENVRPLFPFCFCIHVSKTDFPLIPPGDGLRFKGSPSRVQSENIFSCVLTFKSIFSCVLTFM